MINLKNIYKQAKKNNKTGNMTYKEFKELMKDKGISNKDIKKSLQARNYASQVFYTPKLQPVLEDDNTLLTEQPTFNNPQNIPLVPYSKEYYEVTPKNLTITPVKGYDRAALLRTKENLQKPDLSIYSTSVPVDDREIQIENPIMQQYWRTADYTTPVLKQNWGWQQMDPSNPYGRKPLIYEKAKFTRLQKGGSVKQSSSQQDAVMQFVKALAQTLQADPQQVIQAAQQNPEALKSAVQVYQESKGDIQKAAQAFSQVLQSKTQAAKHGAKLNYLKSLKNQCADDEELYYFKKGGLIGCGCKKKEQGGELKEKKESTVSKFKKACGGLKAKFMAGGQSPKKKNLDQASKDSIEINDNQNMGLMSERPGKLIPNPKYDKGKTDDRAQLWVPDRTKTPYKKEEKVKKDCGGSKMKLKKGDKVCPKCGKVHAAGAGCIAKFKMHKQGGSLNRIPFYQKGTTEGGIKQYPEDEFSGWDLVPFVGTARDIRRAYHNPNVQTIGTAAVSTAADIIGGGMLGAFGKGLLKSAKFAKKLKRLGYAPITENGNTYFKIGTKMKTPTTSSINIEPSIPTVSVHNIPAVDYTPVVNTMIAPVGRVSNYALWGVPTQK